MRTTIQNHHASIFAVVVFVASERSRSGFCVHINLESRLWNRLWHLLGCADDEHISHGCSCSWRWRRASTSRRHSDDPALTSTSRHYSGDQQMTTFWRTFEGLRNLLCQLVILYALRSSHGIPLFLLDLYLFSVCWPPSLQIRVDHTSTLWYYKYFVSGLKLCLNLNI